MFLGLVIKVWDLGIAIMKKGELVKFICKFKYVYGEVGLLFKILFNVIFIFEVEFVSWKGIV